MYQRLRWWRHRRHDLAMRAVEMIVGRGQVVADIGANHGLFTVRLLDLVGRRGTVHAFEPHPGLVDRLRRLADAPNYHVHQVALSDRTGYADLKVPVAGDRHWDAMGSLEGDVGTMPADIAIMTVRIARLDEVICDVPALDFVKCDVEGHEDRVLDGATELLSRFRPNILIELEHRHRGLDPRATIEKLSALGLRGWGVYADRLRPAEEFDVERDQLCYLPYARHDGLMPPGYVNNFLFTRPEVNVRVLAAAQRR